MNRRMFLGGLLAAAGSAVVPWRQSRQVSRQSVVIGGIDPPKAGGDGWYTLTYWVKRDGQPWTHCSFKTEGFPQFEMEPGVKYADIRYYLPCGAEGETISIPKCHENCRAQSGFGLWPRARVV